jgi:hypothetical protein
MGRLGHLVQERPALIRWQGDDGDQQKVRVAQFKLDCDHAPTAHSRPGQELAAMSMLRRSNQAHFMKQ